MQRKEQRKYVEVIQNSGESLLTLINDILDFSKIEAGKLEIDDIDFNLQSVLEDTVDLISVKAREKGISEQEMTTLDAIYVYKTEYCKPEATALINTTIERIKNTPEWMDDILKKAIERNVSMEEMIEMDAKYVYDTELKGK